MTAPLRAVGAQFEAPGHRYTDQELVDLAQPRPPQPPPDPAVRTRFLAQQLFNQKLLKFLTDEGAAAWLEPSPRDGGTITVMGGGSRDAKDALVLPRVAVAIDHYGRSLPTLDKHIP